MAACPSCGEENPERARFCLACGQPLGAGVEAEPEHFHATVTLLFSDVVGSTALGSRVDPEVLSHVMSAYYETMKPIVEDHAGRVVKFIGDALVAVWGLPRGPDGDALQACRAAVAMRDRLEALNDELERTRGLRIGTRTGITTGAVAGKGDDLVAGETSLVASSVQSAAEPGEVLIAEPTYQLVRESIDAQELPAVELKRDAAPVKAYRLLALRADAA